MLDNEPDEVTADIGGVQGSDPEETAPAKPDAAAEDSPTDVPVPDAGEIEWSGAVVGKAPGGSEPT